MLLRLRGVEIPRCARNDMDQARNDKGRVGHYVDRVGNDVDRDWACTWIVIGNQRGS